jgi:hypothetical protein
LSIRAAAASIAVKASATESAIIRVTSGMLRPSPHDPNVAGLQLAAAWLMGR